MHQSATLEKHPLASSRLYDLAMWVFGAKRLNRWFVHELLRPEAGQSVYEAGCGTGALLAAMPPMSAYFGFDISEEYVSAARRLYPEYEFEASTAEHLLGSPPRAADVFFCLGLLHHLDDEQVRAVVRLAVRNLKPGGRFVALEPCYLRHQNGLGRWMTSMDRGKHVRPVHAYLELVAEGFGSIKSDVVNGLNNLCYTHLAIEAKSVRGI